MTPHSHVFYAYQSLSTSKQTTIANGTFVQISGQGTVTLNPRFSIKQVLHVPSLSANLVSIHQLTKDMNCQAIFSPYLCEFQAMTTGRMIGATRECNGLYYLMREHLSYKETASNCCLLNSVNLQL